MSSDVIEADTLFTSFIKIRRHGFVIKYMSVYIIFTDSYN